MSLQQSLSQNDNGTHILSGLYLFISFYPFHTSFLYYPGLQSL